MTFKKRITEATGIDESLIPSSYQIIGDIGLMKFMNRLDFEDKKKIAEFLKKEKNLKTVCESFGVDSELRTPIIDILLGNDTVTIHRENGILYKIDVSKVMFSKGNFVERNRLSKLVNKNEIIVDMFAGIGYFSLGLNCKKIYAIEKNPESFSLLKDNILLNKCKNIEPFLGDCRDFTFKADRIIMGYFPGTEKFLKYALDMNPKIIHFHNQYPDDLLWEKPLEDLKILSDFKIIEKRIVKSSGPRMSHIVIDVEIC